MTAVFDIAFTDLPRELPVFPLPRVILLPRVQLPLNIFEPRYLAMIRAALAGPRLIGMIQPKPDGQSLSRTGCAGRITSFSETEDGRYLVTLKGVCRFDVEKELAQDKGGFRVVVPSWQNYAHDLTEETADICRDSMMQTLRAYFDKRGMFCDKWETMQGISCDKLIATLSVVCPLAPDEKQALVEAVNLPERARILQGLLQNALKEDDEKPCCH